MNALTKRNCIALAAASVLAAACATDNAGTEAAVAPAAVPSAAAPAQSPAASSPSRAPAAPVARAPGAPRLVTTKAVPAERSVYYDLDQHDIKPEFRPAIEAHARYLRENPGAKLTIEGNGDERGSREYNLALGQRRAETVRQLMRLSGAADAQIETVSFGEEKPKARGHDEASWAQNRRSDIVYQRGE